MGTERLGRGLILLENIVALIIMGVAVAGFAASFYWAQARNVIAEHKLQAINFSQEVLDDLYRLDDYADLELDPNHGAYDILLPNCILRDKFGATRLYTVGSATEGKKITVTTRWAEEGQPKEEVLYGLIIQKQ